MWFGRLKRAAEPVPFVAPGDPGEPAKVVTAAAGVIFRMT
jgi:hypothetical protein